MNSALDPHPGTNHPPAEPADGVVDAEARRQALDPEHSFAVAAPAGSGKTGLLTQRVLRLLALCRHPEEVLCITFTRKAAGEMRERISQALEKAHQPAPSQAHEQRTWALARAVVERDRELGWKLSSAPKRLRIQTIDGLCRALTAALPLTSGLGALPNTLEQPEQAYRLAVQELFKGLEEEGPLQQHLGRLLRHLDNRLDQLENLLVSLLQKREQWLGFLMAAQHDEARDYLQGVLREIITSSLQRCREQLAAQASDLVLLADFAAAHLAQPDSAIGHCAGLTELPGAEPEALPQWLGLCELLLTKNGWRKRLTKTEGFPAGGDKAEKLLVKSRKEALLGLINCLGETPGLLDQLLGLRELPPPSYSEGQWRILDSLTHILPLLVAELKLVFRHLAACDYSEISQAALLALGDEDAPSDAALRLDYQIQHILVDEFQDTASPQLQLLQKLTHGWQPGDGRSLFIVGDAMQSCYGFRDANVGIFLDARQQGIGQVHLTALDLTVNFRSQSAVVDWVNQHFKRAFPAADDIARGAVRYKASDSLKPAEPLAAPFPQAVTVIGCHDSEEAALSGREQEAAQIVELVRHTQAQRPEDSLAILVRNRSHLRDTLKALSSAGLKWQATEIDPLARRMAIVDLLSLTRALLHPEDRLAWLAVLRAPWCGLDLWDLHSLSLPLENPHGSQNPQAPAEATAPPLALALILAAPPPGLSPEGQTQFARLQKVLADSWQQRRRKGLRQWIEGTWLALGGPATLLEASDQDNCQAYFALLEAREEAGQIANWEAFNQAVEQLYAAPQRDADPRLQVMTIHKSKGLEFDTVIIPGLDRLARADDKQLLLWQERIRPSTHDGSGEKQLLISPLAAAGSSSDSLYQYLHREKAQQHQLEATRLLYVGCTRAIRQLFLLAALKTKTDKEGEPELRAPAKSSLLGAIWPSVKDHYQPCRLGLVDTGSQAQPHGQAEPDQDWEQDCILRLSPTWQAPVLRIDNSLQDFRGQEFDDEDNTPEPPALHSRYHRHLGTVLHRTLAQIGGEGCQGWDSARIQGQLPFWHIQLRQLGLKDREVQRAGDNIARALECMLADPVGQWLLDPRHRDSACELTLYQAGKHQQAKASIVDRTFIGDSLHHSPLAKHAGDKAKAANTEFGINTPTRWIIDYKSAEPSQGQALADFIRREVEEYRSQLARYAQLFRQKESHPVQTALYFPLLGQLEIVAITDN